VLATPQFDINDFGNTRIVKGVRGGASSTVDRSDSGPVQVTDGSWRLRSA
jgi:hypothetical protein